ncbi:hypothetical protein EDB85DRAFT_1902910 [Lactarius pseudohatsudake]|nr:hypothetical protein EDB85DRAFT_1902910 [Lactarius pseudohatsudake]
MTRLRSGALPTAEDIVQVLAYSSMGDTRQIVTGIAEKGAEMVIQYWVQQSGPKKPIELKSRVEEKPGWAYLATHKQVSTAIIITFGLVILLAATKWDQIAVSINWAKDSTNFTSKDWSSSMSEDGPARAARCNVSITDCNFVTIACPVMGQAEENGYIPIKQHLEQPIDTFLYRHHFACCGNGHVSASMSTSLTIQHA